MIESFNKYETYDIVKQALQLAKGKAGRGSLKSKKINYTHTNDQNRSEFWNGFKTTVSCDI